MQKVFTYTAQVKISYSQQNSITVEGSMQSYDNDVSKDEIATYLLDNGWISVPGGGKINLNSNSVMGFEVVGLKVSDVEHVSDEALEPAKELPHDTEDEVMAGYTEDESEKMYVYMEFTLGKTHHQTLMPVDWEYDSAQEQLESLPFVKDATTHKWVSFLSNRKPIVTKELNLTEDEMIDFMGGKKDE